MQPISVLFPAHIHRSIIHHLCRCYTQPLIHLEHILSAFPCTNRHDPSFKCLSDYVAFNVKAKCSCIIDVYHTIIQKYPQAYDMSHDDLVLSVLAQHQYFLAQQPIFDDLHGIRPESNSNHDEILHTSFFTVL